jgi:hypothetical protein
MGIGSLPVPEHVLVCRLAEAARARRPAIDGYDAAAAAGVETAKRIYAGHDEKDFSDWRSKALPTGTGRPRTSALLKKCRCHAKLAA